MNKKSDIKSKEEMYKEILTRYKKQMKLVKQLEKQLDEFMKIDALMIKSPSNGMIINPIVKQKDSALKTLDMLAKFLDKLGEDLKPGNKTNDANSTNNPASLMSNLVLK